MGGLLGVEIERSGLAAVTCVGAPDVSGGRESCSRGGDLMSLGSVGADELTLFGEKVGGILERAKPKEASACMWNLRCADSHSFSLAIGIFNLGGRG